MSASPNPPPARLAPSPEADSSRQSGFAPPEGYKSPTWPSLYNPLLPTEAEFLYFSSDIVRFTTTWSLIFFSAVYGVAALWGYFVLVRRRPKLAWILPVVFALVAGLVALLSGVVFGLVLGAVYNAGQFPMSTWTPLMWALMQVLITLIGAYSPMSTYL